MRLTEQQIEAKISAFDSLKDDVRRKAQDALRQWDVVKRRLAPLSKCWHHALKKTERVLAARLDEYYNQRDLLRDKKDAAYNIRVRVYGERDPAIYG